MWDCFMLFLLPRRMHEWSSTSSGKNNVSLRLHLEENQGFRGGTDSEDRNTISMDVTLPLLKEIWEAVWADLIRGCDDTPQLTWWQVNFLQQWSRFSRSHHLLLPLSFHKALAAFSKGLWHLLRACIDFTQHISNRRLTIGWLLKW